MGRICREVFLFSNDEGTFEWTTAFRGSCGNNPLHGRIRVCLDFRDGIFGRNHKDKKSFGGPFPRAVKARQTWPMASNHSVANTLEVIRVLYMLTL